MIDKYNSCSNCKYFIRFYAIKNGKFKKTIYGRCQKRKRVFADKYYCGNYKQEGGSYDNSKSR